MVARVVPQSARRRHAESRKPDLRGGSAGGKAPVLDDAHRTSPTSTPSAGASSELANRHSHLPVGRALEEQLFLPPAARGIASFAAVCAVFLRWKCSNYCVRSL